MAGSRPNFFNQLIEVWSRLQRNQRITVLAFAFLALAGLGLLVYFMNRVDYEVLYRDLNPEDAQAIAAKLKEEKRDFRVEGTSILVAAPKTEVDKLRLEVAGSGLARSGRVGYEIFDKNQFGMTDFTEQVNLQRALEGELCRTISCLSEVAEARVHLVLPKDSIFEEKREAAKASVVVRLKKGAELSKPGIAGIRGVVAGAVPGLRTYNVSIVDDEGNLLSQAVESADGARGELESGIREQLEKDMVAKVVSILDPVVGKGKVHAKASIELDFNSMEQTEESFTPNPSAVLSQQKTEERMGGGASASGVPGTQSSASGPNNPNLGNNPERIRLSEVTNYEVSKLVRHTVQPKGTIRRLSVAVILDHKPTYTKDADGKVTVSYQARSQQELDAYRELVNAAVGFDKERGDVITLENVPFFYDTRPEEDRPPVPWYVGWQSYLLPAIKYASFILLFLLAYLVLFRPIRKRIFESVTLALPQALQREAAALGPESVPKAIAGVSGREARPAVEGGPTEAPGEERPPGEETLGLEALDGQIERELLKEAAMVGAGTRKFSILRKKLVERAKKEPEMISQVIRSWLQQKE